MSFREVLNGVQVEINTILRLEQITKSFGETLVLKGIDLSVYRGEFITLLGPSGCGKTTTLRIIAGLEIPDSGKVILEGRDVTFDEPNTRSVNTVFQNYALFPHMSVEANIGYSLRLKRVDKATIKNKVDEVLELVQLSGYSKRMPHELSGGQKQRVAIARAVINQPKVLLLDEPLGALDLQLRREMQTELKRFQTHLGITFIYITHDQEEALNMSDRIAVMNEGAFVQIGTPAEVYDRPQTAFTARFVGSANIIEGKLLSQDKDTVTFSCGDGIGIANLHSTPLTPGQSIAVAVRREHLHLLKTAPENAHGFDAIVKEKSFSGGVLQILLSFGEGKELIASRHGLDSNLSPGDHVFVTWDPEHAVPVDLENPA
ncbi:MAG: ABC transporter ATP-binding protein [Clostridiaceae bacterium]|jgi:spermidine/putrescine transport system ATP-binding protein|nr:ABC transporter ATP-binding protein [Clostridiaceae bacterium]